ncbi:MAG: hypothetical protein KJ732_06695 [Candidatus Margulisbacteria bacterium]|nr:hypothetical protein [Candidatus Margulisiibacteriota bacterium]
MNNKKRLIFCDSLPAAELCPKIAAGGQDCLFIALTPDVKVRLQELRLPVSDTLPYFPSVAHEKALHASKEAVDRLRFQINFVDLGLGLKTAYRDIFIYWFRFVVHYCLFMIELINAAIQQHQPSEMIVFNYCQTGKNGIYVEPEDNYLAELIKAISEKAGLDYKIVQVPKAGIFPTHLLSRAKQLAGLFRIRVYGKDLKSNPSTRPIVLTSPTYRMDKLAKDLAKEFPSRPVTFLAGALSMDIDLPGWLLAFLSGGKSAELKEQIKMCAEFSNKVANERSGFVYKGVCYADILADKIKKYYTGFVLMLLLASLLLDRELGCLNPEAVLSNVSRIDDLLLAELCQAKNIPNILLSHGSHVKPKNTAEIIEWGEHGIQFLSAPFSHIAVQTPTTKQYFDAFPTDAELTKTGPVTWGTKVDRSRSGALFQSLFGKKFEREKVKIIMHAGTPKASGSLRFFVYETCDEYIQGIRELAEVVNQSDNLLLVVKFRPSKEISVATLKKLIPFSDRVVLSVVEPLLDVLGLADLVVSFSSTAIDEALQNCIPVLQYGGVGRYQHLKAVEIGDEALSPAAVFHLNGQDDLHDGLQRLFALKLDPSIFDPYIYPKTECKSIAQLIKEKVRIT